jgi:type IV pilus assembly protein PilC
MSKQEVPWYKREIVLSRVKMEDTVTMTKNLSVMLEAGLTVPESLAVLEEQTTGAMKKVLTEVSKEVQGGSALADAIKKHPRVFTPLFVSSVSIGESSGTLSENLTHLATQMERALEIRRSIQGAMLYPGVVISATVILGLALATFVLPQMASIFTSLNIELPWATRVMIWFAEVFQDHGRWLSPTIIVAIFGFITFLRRPAIKPFVDYITLKIPGVKPFLHNINRAQFCRSVGTMLQSGVPIQETLSIGSNILPNTLYNRSVAHMSERIASGDGFAEIMEAYPNYYPKMIQRMVAVGERSGSLGDSLLFLAKFYEEKVARQAKNMSTIIEPLLLIFIGLGVGFLAIAIFTPIYSVTGGLTI